LRNIGTSGAASSSSADLVERVWPLHQKRLAFVFNRDGKIPSTVTHRATPVIAGHSGQPVFFY